ncbi:hypothetical protein SAMN06265365_102253 [Tistlia consotensis]|uniref:Uncharacterized protein n=1 Tax=Tistlia consotensis USBA 355 TaxID=560819 RepID=A0A1Y6BJT9_9PROT|nr:hypothetical protein [Tistlia consotensis]SMF07449.1 hypothetical protein SAMN05428998_10463 [Tistlia consotensis USBA 355]SNR35887.1 hypothetical protein SAMN06265365_102253 [Tistlia consotensis]
MTMLAAERWYDRSYPLMRLEYSPYQAGIPDLTEDDYLDFRGTVLGYEAFTYDWDNVVDAARKADVLFLGNSLMVYSFRPQYFQPWLDKLGLRGFSMAFIGSGGYMPLWVIRRYDLHPKMVVISDERFLELNRTLFEEKARGEGAWNAFKHYYGVTIKWLVQKHLHQLVPPLRDFTDPAPFEVIYRSRRDGAPIFAYALTEGKTLTRLPGPQPSEAVKKWIDQVLPQDRITSAEFLREMDKRGILVVLTVLQDNASFAGYFLSKRLNEENRRIFVEAMRPDLTSQVGPHIDAQSSKRLMDDVMPRILALPQVQALARKPARSKP